MSKIRKEYSVGLILVGLVVIGIIAIIISPESSVPKQIAPSGSGMSKGVSYKEIVNPSDFVNTGNIPIKIADYVGEKVIMLDIMTYSCINCQRTFPYITSWYETYKDDGFIVIGIHTPEFAFEKDKKNVEAAMKEFGITFPVVMDNEYGTWNAYGNRYWPRKYLIDIYGNIVYDHIGEGDYEETEMKIKELLKERAKVLGEDAMMDGDDDLVFKLVPKLVVASRSPETYFGSLRNEYLGNGVEGRSGKQTFILPAEINPNTLYLGGEWDIAGEHAESVSGSKVVYKYNAKEVYIVASSISPAEIEVWQDGKLVTSDAGGASVAGVDVSTSAIMTVQESKLYKIIRNAEPGEHTLELRVKGEGVLLFAFTFG